VDCHHNESTHCAVNFGIFLCEECAQEHLKVLGMEHSYIKELFSDHWDGFQLRMLEPAYGGGNHVWFELMKEFEVQPLAIALKYKTSIALYRRKVLFMRASGDTSEVPLPAKNLKEKIQKSTG